MTTEDPLVYILGPNRIQNDLLASFIESEASISCRSAACFEEEVAQAADGREVLVLVDCGNHKHEKQMQRLANQGGLDRSICLVAFFNVAPDDGVEEAALKLGARGVFLSGTSPDTFSRGIPAILSGELWYSRKTLSRLALTNGHAEPQPDQNPVNLTLRELEILKMIRKGARYKDIASELCLSLHTVKSHMYHIYKKLDVKNRIDAIKAAPDYLKLF